MKACPANAGLYMALKNCFSFATYLAANFVCNWFRIMSYIIYKHFLLCHLSRRTLKTGCQFRSAVLHRIQFTTCRFVVVPYCYPDTNEWSKDWEKQWTLLWLVPSYSEIHQNSYFTWKKKWVVSDLSLLSLQSIKPFWPSN